MRRLIILLLLLFTAACGENAVGPEDIPGSGPERGERLFSLNPLGTAPGCMTCHALTADVVLVGPALPEMAQAAVDQGTGLSAEAYLRQAILEPDAVIAPEFNPGAMPRYGAFLSDADVDDLVAYILAP